MRTGTYHRNLVGMSRLTVRSQSTFRKGVDDLHRIVQELFRVTFVACQAWNGHIRGISIKYASLEDVEGR